MFDRELKHGLQQLCNRLQLGGLADEPYPLSGGLLHEMYAVHTDDGRKHAVKALNPVIMRRPAAMGNYVNSERIAEVAARRIPALPAKRWQGTAVIEAEGRFYLVFDWVEGIRLQANEIQPLHCAAIGSLLAELHDTDFSELALTASYEDPAPANDWRSYAQLGMDSGAEWAPSLLRLSDRLHEWEEGAREAAVALAANHVISHRDMDAKNVMWQGDEPIVIDWEAAGYIHPLQDLAETALYWSAAEGGADHGRFRAFVQGYCDRRRIGEGVFAVDWHAVLRQGFAGKLGWLAYNLRRSLGMESSSEQERLLGTEQVFATMNDMTEYADQLLLVERWLIALTEEFA